MQKVKLTFLIQSLRRRGIKPYNIANLLNTSKQYVNQVLKNTILQFDDVIVQKVFARDDHKCRARGCTQDYTDNTLTIHNLNKDKRIYTMDTMVTVCKNCYQKLNP